MADLSRELWDAWNLVCPNGQYRERPSHTPVHQTTYFFRYQDEFEWVARDLALNWDEQKTPRVLSLGGSTGAEAYSLAMIFNEAGLFGRFADLRIEMVDIDPVATKLARAGVYPHPHRGFFA